MQSPCLSLILLTFSSREYNRHLWAKISVLAEKIFFPHMQAMQVFYFVGTVTGRSRMVTTTYLMIGCFFSSMEDQKDVLYSH